MLHMVKKGRGKKELQMGEYMREREGEKSQLHASSVCEKAKTLFVSISFSLASVIFFLKAPRSTGESCKNFGHSR